MGRDCASNPVPIALAEGRPEEPGGGLCGAALGDVARTPSFGFARGAWFRAACAGRPQWLARGRLNPFMRIDGHDEPGHPCLFALSLPSACAPQRGERMLVAALPEGFEVLVDPVGNPLGELATIGGGDGDLGLERDAGGDLGQRLKRGRCVHPSSGRAFSGAPLRGDYGFGDRNDDLVGSRGGWRRVGGAHVSHPAGRMGRPSCPEGFLRPLCGVRLGPRGGLQWAVQQQVIAEAEGAQVVELGQRPDRA